MEDFKPWGQEVKTFCTLMHLAQFAGMLIPGAGIVLPLVMWLTNKDQSSIIDQHGRVIANWILSALIYGLICFILVFVFIGVIGFFVLFILNVIFIIVGAVKSQEDVVWTYPMSIKFFRTEPALP